MRIPAQGRPRGSAQRVEYIVNVASGSAPAVVECKRWVTQWGELLPGKTFQRPTTGPV